jgi:hypothetical protein
MDDNQNYVAALHRSSGTIKMSGPCGVCHMAIAALGHHQTASKQGKSACDSMNSKCILVLHNLINLPRYPLSVDKTGSLAPLGSAFYSDVQ